MDDATVSGQGTTEAEGGPATATMSPPPPAPPVPPVGTGAPGPGPGHGGKRHHRNGGVSAGIVLVLIGGVLLAGQFVPGIAWWSLWPLIIVVVGLVSAVTADEDGWSVNKFFDGLVTVAFGLVLLGCTMGYLPWSVWWRILWLWPVLLISAGIGIIGKAVGQKWLGAIGSALVIVALAWVSLGAYQLAPMPTLSFVGTGGGRAQVDDFSEPVNGATSGKLDLSVGAAAVRLTGGSDLVSLHSVSPWGAPTTSVLRSGSDAVVKVGFEHSGLVVIPNGSDSKLDLQLARDVVWNAKVASGATSMDLDFSDIRLKGLDVSTGASDVNVKLGDPGRAGLSGQVPVVISSGVSSIKVRLPKGAQARLHLQTALVGTSAAGFRRTGDTYETPGLDASKPFWDVTVKSGVGSVDVFTY